MSVFFINPFLFEAGADFESIATVTVGSGGASSIEFTSIPGTYQHLQIRAILRTTRAAVFDSVNIKFNGSSTGYAHHQLYGGGSTGAAGAASATAINTAGLFNSDSSGASRYGVMVLDVLDYATASKTRVLRHLSGADDNTTGWIGVGSGLWDSTSAVTSIALTSNAAANFTQYSTAALYGIKAP